MTNTSQLQQDLRFLRHAVDRKDHHRRPAIIMWIVAAYVLLGYTLLDYSPHVASWFLGIGGVISGGVNIALARRFERKRGVQDRTSSRRASLHWFGGILLVILSATALAAIEPALRGQAFGQLIVVMIGLVYFLGGVHYDRHFLWLGPLMIAGGIAVKFIPSHAWTLLGVVIALGLVVPTFFKGSPEGEHPAGTNAVAA